MLAIKKILKFIPQIVIFSILTTVFFPQNSVKASSIENKNAINLHQSVQSQVYGEEKEVFVNDYNEERKPYIVKLKNDIKDDLFVKKNESLIKSIKMKFINKHTFLMNLNERELLSLRNDENVLFVEEDSSITILSIESKNADLPSEYDQLKIIKNNPWNDYSVQDDLNKDHNKAGDSIKIAILDTGVNNQELNVQNGVTFVSGTIGYQDDHGHGTIMARTVNSFAPNSEINAVKVLNNNGVGTYSQVIEGIYWAIENKMNIISICFGGPIYSQAFHESIKEATDNGILIVAASDGSNMGYDSMLDLMAPGTDILSNAINQGYDTYITTPLIAAPYVTAAAVLLWSSHKSWSSNQVKSRLFDTATPLGDITKALGVIDSPSLLNNGLPMNISNDFYTKLNSYNKKLLQRKSQAEAENNRALSKKIATYYKELLIEIILLHNVNPPIEIYKDSDAVTESVYSNLLLDKSVTESVYSNLLLGKSVTESVYSNLLFRKSMIEFDEILSKYEEIFRLLKMDYEKDDIDYLKTEFKTEFVSKMSLNSVFPSLTLHTPVDVSLSKGEYTVYSFTPPQDGQYRFYTGPYGGFGDPNDTYLHLYSDENLANQISYNDDANGTAFSEIKINLKKKTTYYIKLRPYSTKGTVYASLGVSLPSNIININNPEDVYLWVNESKVYKFTPPSYGSYVFQTSYYEGQSSNGPSDTVLSIYKDENLLYLIGDNDDSNGTLFSTIFLNMSPDQNYYIKLEGAGGDSIEARLSVSQLATDFLILSPNSSTNIAKSLGSPAFIKFTPVVSGVYKIKTSPYAQGNSVNDTEIALYSQPTFNNLLCYSNDNKDSVFSEMNCKLDSGKTYYLILREINGLSLYANLSIREWDVSPPKASGVSAPKNVTYSVNGSYEVYAYGVTDFESGVASVKFLTFTEVDGEDYMVSHPGINLGNGTWKAIIPFNQHSNEVGIYNTYVQAEDNSGNVGIMMTFSVNVNINGKFQYIYDPTTGLLDHILLPNGQLIDYEYDANGNLKKTMLKKP